MSLMVYYTTELVTILYSIINSIPCSYKLSNEMLDMILGAKGASINYIAFLWMGGDIKIQQYQWLLEYEISQWMYSVTFATDIERGIQIF